MNLKTPDGSDLLPGFLSSSTLKTKDSILYCSRLHRPLPLRGRDQSRRMMSLTHLVLSFTDQHDNKLVHPWAHLVEEQCPDIRPQMKRLRVKTLESFQTISPRQRFGFTRRFHPDIWYWISITGLLLVYSGRRRHVSSTIHIFVTSQNCSSARKHDSWAVSLWIIVHGR